MTRTAEAAGDGAGGSTVVRGRRLVVLRAAWAAVVTFYVALYVFSVPLQIKFFQTPCPTADTCSNNQITVVQLHRLQQSGMSAGFYGYFATALITVSVVVFLAVAAVIFWRKSDDWMGILVSLTLVVFGINFGEPLDAVGVAYPGLATLLHFANPSGIALAAFFCLFPDGRPAPRWTIWLVAESVVQQALSPLYQDTALSLILIIVELVGIPALMVYRYVRVFDTVRRLQTKWVVFGSLVALTGFAVLLGIQPADTIGAPALIALRAGMFAFLLLIPISIGMAILRSHLWDIDIIIRRTLIYALLTAVLALVYFGSVVVLQEVLRAVTGEGGSTLATVISTLAIAALFTPLRRRIQAGVDRRFYRQNYDAARVLSDFGAAVRDEVDLDRLSERLVAVIDETMHPAYVSLALRAPERETRERGFDASGFSETGRA